MWSRSGLRAMALGVVLVDFAFFLGGDALVGAVAVGLVFGQAAHANPDGFFLGLDFEGTEVGFEDFAHGCSLQGSLWESQPVRGQSCRNYAPILQSGQML